MIIIFDRFSLYLMRNLVHLKLQNKLFQIRIIRVLRCTGLLHLPAGLIIQIIFSTLGGISMKSICPYSSLYELIVLLKELRDSVQWMQSLLSFNFASLQIIGWRKQIMKFKTNFYLRTALTSDVIWSQLLLPFPVEFRHQHISRPETINSWSKSIH